MITGIIIKHALHYACILKYKQFCICTLRIMVEVRAKLLKRDILRFVSVNFFEQLLGARRTRRLEIEELLNLEKRSPYA